MNNVTSAVDAETKAEGETFGPTGRR